MVIYQEPGIASPVQKYPCTLLFPFARFIYFTSTDAPLHKENFLIKFVNESKLLKLMDVEFDKALFNKDIYFFKSCTQLQKKKINYTRARREGVSMFTEIGLRDFD